MVSTPFRSIASRTFQGIVLGGSEGPTLANATTRQISLDGTSDFRQILASCGRVFQVLEIVWADILSRGRKWGLSLKNFMLFRENLGMICAQNGKRNYADSGESSCLICPNELPKMKSMNLRNPLRVSRVSVKDCSRLITSYGK